MSALAATQRIITVGVPHPAKRVYARRLGLPWGVIGIGESFYYPRPDLSLRRRQQAATTAAKQRRHQTDQREAYSCCIVEEEGERRVRITRIR